MIASKNFQLFTFFTIIEEYIYFLLWDNNLYNRIEHLNEPNIILQKNYKADVRQVVKQTIV